MSPYDDRSDVNNSNNNILPSGVSMIDVNKLGPDEPWPRWVFTVQ